MVAIKTSLKLTAKAPENGWLEDDPFLLGWPIFRCYVSCFRECIPRESFFRKNRIREIPGFLFI